MKKSVLLIIALILLSVFISCKNQKENVTPKDLYYDIERIQIDMAYSPLKEVYDPEPFEQLKAELDALYGHVQINSHFLLNFFIQFFFRYRNFTHFCFIFTTHTNSQ